MIPRCKYKDRVYRRVEVRASQTSVSGLTAPSLIKFKDLFGGSIQASKVAQQHHRPIWRWRATDGGAHDFLTEVWPFLIEKKEQASIALAAFDDRQGVHRGGIPDHHVALLRASRNGTSVDSELELMGDA